MFVVARPFRDKLGMVPAGSIVEPAGISRFEYRIGLGHIVEVNEQNFEEYTHLFKERFGIDLSSVEAEVPEAEVHEAEVPEAKVPEAKVPEAEVHEAEVHEAKVPEAKVPEAKVPEAEVPEAEVKVVKAVAK